MIKKIITIVQALVLVIVMASPALAGPIYNSSRDVLTPSVSIAFKVGLPYLVENGKSSDFLMDPPFLQNNRVYIEVRSLGQALGMTGNDITWDGATRTVTIKGVITMQMTIGMPQVIINGNIRQIDAAPLLINNRVFLPARYVTESFGYQVAWDDKNQVGICWAQGQQQPDVSNAINQLSEQYRQPLLPPPAKQATTWTGITGNGRFFMPSGIAVDSSGHVYVGDQRNGINGKIKKLVNGAWTDITGNGSFDWPTGIAVDSSGNVYVADYFGDKIEKLASSSSVWADITGNGDFKGLVGVAADNSGNVYVADNGNKKIKKLAGGSSTWTDITGNGSFNTPQGIAVDSAGNVYVADYLSGKIKKMAP